MSNKDKPIPACSRQDCDHPAVASLTFQSKHFYFCATHFQYYTNTTTSKTITTTTATQELLRVNSSRPSSRRSR